MPSLIFLQAVEEGNGKVSLLSIVVKFSYFTDGSKRIGKSCKNGKVEIYALLWK